MLGLLTNTNILKIIVFVRSWINRINYYYYNRMNYYYLIWIISVKLSHFNDVVKLLNKTFLNYKYLTLEKTTTFAPRHQRY